MSQLIKRITKKGFTLIELMIVVAIIGILAAIAIPKFAELITKSKESSAKGTLGAVRSAITIYYSDTEGYFPLGASTNLVNALTLGSKYLDNGANVSITIPKNGPPNSNPGHGTATFVDANVEAANDDDGGWTYTQATGQLNIDCSHADTKTSIWNLW